MIVAIEGEIVRKEPSFLHIKTDCGVVYGAHISLNSSSKIEKGDRVYLNTTLITKEDSQTLYGFMDFDEKRLFDKVIKLNGVGPSIALAICSTFTPKEFAEVIASKDVNRLKMVPGIGPKSAKRILIELSDFDLFEEESQTSYKKEAFMALESLGFKKDSISKVLRDCKSENVADLVKEALKKLTKKG